MALIEAYKVGWPEEFYLLKDALEMKRKMLRDGLEWTEGSEMVPMYEVSETLMAGLIRALDTEESTWFKSKEGGRWFIKAFPMFSLLEESLKAKQKYHFL